jgi:hypothetical protein
LVDDQKHYVHHFGILEKKGKYDIYKPAPIAEWQQDKRKILQQRFASHEFWIGMGGEYSTICDATTMLFQSGIWEEYN